MDLNALPNMLASLGPWGIVIGVAVTLFVQWLRARMGPNQPPLLPGPSQTPLLDALLAILRERLRPKVGGDDITPAKFAEVVSSLENEKVQE